MFGSGLQTSLRAPVDLSRRTVKMLGAVKLSIGHRPEIQGSISSNTRLGGVQNNYPIASAIG